MSVSLFSCISFYVFHNLLGKKGLNFYYDAKLITCFCLGIISCCLWKFLFGFAIQTIWSLLQHWLSVFHKYILCLYMLCFFLLRQLTFISSLFTNKTCTYGSRISWHTPFSYCLRVVCIASIFTSKQPDPSSSQCLAFSIICLLH